jgi:hypothetical protein
MGVVYCIRCKITGETYYGSSIQSIPQRMEQHRSKRNKTSSCSIIERGDYEVIVIEEVEDWLLPYYEKYYIKNFPCVNIKLPFATKEENIQNDQKQSNRYHQTHQTEIRQRKAIPYECECGHTITLSKKARHLRTQRHLQGIRDLGGNSPATIPPVIAGLVV